MSSEAGASLTAPVSGGGRGDRFPAWLWRRFGPVNPILVRELRQIARRRRTPMLLASLTALSALLIASIGGVASATTEPARVGFVLFHTYFSFAFAFVTWVGPALSAGGIAGERSGKTWEALLLTGMRPAEIARGKFLAAFAHLSLYLIMLAPVGGMALLFGGITEAEVAIAFGLLFALAGLSVAFGLAVSSLFSGIAPALVVTLLLSGPASFVAYTGLGVGLSFVVHELWPAVVSGAPVWLPSAYVRAPFDLKYLVLLLFTPGVLAGVTGWFLYEVAVLQLSSPSDDRSTRLRFWFCASAPALTVLFLATAKVLDEPRWVLFGLGALAVFFGGIQFLFAGEPLEPSRRVLLRWQREQRGKLFRAFGPSVIGAHLWLGALELMLIGATAGAGMLWAKSPEERDSIAAVAGYFAGFLWLLLGVSAFARAHSERSSTPRVLLLVTLFTVSVGPWMAVSILRLWQQAREMVLITVPSPSYLITMLEAIRNHHPGRGTILAAGLIGAGGYAALGLILLFLAALRVRRRLREVQVRDQSLATGGDGQ